MEVARVPGMVRTRIVASSGAACNFTLNITSNQGRSARGLNTRNCGRAVIGVTGAAQKLGYDGLQQKEQHSGFSIGHSGSIHGKRKMCRDRNRQFGIEIWSPDIHGRGSEVTLFCFGGGWVGETKQIRATIALVPPTLLTRDVKGHTINIDVCHME